MTPSAVVRRMIEDELSGRADWERGDVEQATAAYLELYGIDSTNPRAAAALNMSRRIDRDPTSGTPNTGQLRALLAELMPVHPEGDADALLLLKLSLSFRRRGWTLSDGVGSFDLGTLDRATRSALVEEMRGRAKPGGVPDYGPVPPADVG
ncbi:hypothetical protein E0H75_14255 [Kribbella capetownensis]|uniref:Uncharacterized protein n=1 Tax=Kribbella capetownensis TaxID=1572659 RepID=A0A4R0JW81_9ACTN|nr:hypothetical protein [Kribbella capetownensis]TCC51279.1 hypothetical protein E0H75_14255 [Kribbella capetownensis]